ncbi:hypothetical protein [Intrasporangium sp. YIM S08009]|uniref:hypothetical protein n=1 Tax=Intrasporangium zincisolvens TaxID=3080018 RepID=UPI002B054943|nr:hypothetical protein [Intrasporangium sp. YIM S08009]
MADWVAVVSSLGGAVIGSVIAPALLHRRERLAARGEVRRAISEVEALKFSPGHGAFLRALGAVEANAILAGLPQRVVSPYSLALQQIQSQLEFHENVGPNGESGWGISGSTATDGHAKALRVLSWAFWHPWLSRLARSAP